MAGLRIDECAFAVVDVETTGIDPHHDRIVEVSVLTCDWLGTATDRFETLIRPDDVALTGPRAEMLAEAPTFGEVAGDIVARLAGGVVAGHNVTFDLHFLDRELGRIGARVPGHAYVCTRELATVLGCDVPNRTLAQLCAYCGIAFQRWHTAGDDTAATAAVLSHLLDRAAGYGRVQLAAVQSWWSGPGVAWPALPTGGRVLVRDPERWPPLGDQPGSRRAREASFRRLGAGPASPSGAVVTDEVAGEVAGEIAGEIAGEVAGDQIGSVSQLWWEGDFRGLEGIALLQESVVPAFRVKDDPELIAAVLALADLLRRHGGRDGEVRAVFEEAWHVAARRRRWDLLETTAERWSDYLATLRDTDGLVALLVRSLDTPECPWVVGPAERIRQRVTASAAAEPLVAERLARGAYDVLRQRGADEAWEMLRALLDALVRAGRAEDAMVLAEYAWAEGCTSAALLDWLSLALERADEYGRALDVCARALAGQPRSVDTADAACLERLRKRHRKCQEQLARASTLFG